MPKYCCLNWARLLIWFRFIHRKCYRFQCTFASRQCHYSYSKYVCILLQFYKKQEPYFPNLLFIKTRLYHDWRLLAMRQVHLKSALRTAASSFLVCIQKQLQYQMKAPWKCTSNRFFRLSLWSVCVCVLLMPWISIFCHTCLLSKWQNKYDYFQNKKKYALFEVILMFYLQFSLWLQVVPSAIAKRRIMLLVWVLHTKLLLMIQTQAHTHCFFDLWSVFQLIQQTQSW